MQNHSTSLKLKETCSNPEYCSLCNHLLTYMISQNAMTKHLDKRLNELAHNLNN